MTPNKNTINTLYDAFFISENFDSPPMHIRAKEEVSWLLEKTQLPTTAKILDAACGAGRHLKALVKADYSPTGVDLSTACIDQARTNCPAIQDQIIASDLLDFSKANENHFELVYSAGVSFGYEKDFESNAKYLSALFSLVNSGGYLALQFLNSSWAHSEIVGDSRNWYDTIRYYRLDSQKIEGNCLVSESTYIFKSPHSVKKYSDSVYLFELEEILAKTVELAPNFKFLGAYHSFTEQPYDKLKSAFPVLLFQKTENP